MVRLRLDLIPSPYHPSIFTTAQTRAQQTSAAMTYPQSILMCLTIIPSPNYCGRSF